jgi:3-oxoacyl-[acyl-carrier protein] reductase
MGLEASKELKCQFLKVDQTENDLVEEATKKTIQLMKKIDILVCSAGIAGPTFSTWDYPIEEWSKVFNVNVNGVFYCNKHVVKTMRENGYGRIINIASIAGKEGNPNASAYSASKAAVIALTKSLGKETADHDIAVNCITPATAKTRILDQVSQEFIDYMISKIPRNRFVKVEEIASLITFLASKENSFTTAGVFDISGGRATY